VKSTTAKPQKVGQVVFDDVTGLKNIVQEVFPSSAYSGWILVGYGEGGNLGVVGTSSKGVEELLPHLLDDQVQYALVRIDVEGKTKDVFITLIGPKVGTLEKGKKKSHIGDIHKVMPSGHFTITTYGKSHLNDAELKQYSKESRSLTLNE